MKASSRTGQRRLLSLMGAVAASMVATVGLASPAMASTTVTVGAGADLSGWETTLGGGTFAAAGQDAVTQADVAADNRGKYTSLRSNVGHRGVMADALSFKRITDASMTAVVHRAGYSFQLPSVPSMAGGLRNAQTVEGGLFVWDGAKTKADSGTAFQWVLNPWLPNFGEIRVWSDADGGTWIPAGHLTPDTAWHSVTFLVDPIQQKAAVTVDGTTLAAPYTRMPKAGWGDDVSARLQAEAISVWPGAWATEAPEHEVLIKDWNWTQEGTQAATAEADEPTTDKAADKADKAADKAEKAQDKADQAAAKAEQAQQKADQAAAKAEKAQDKADAAAEKAADKADKAADKAAKGK